MSKYKFEKTTVSFRPTILDSKKRKKAEFRDAMNDVMSEVLSQNGINKHLSKVWNSKDDAKKNSLIKALENKGVDTSKVTSKCFNTKLQLEAIGDWQRQFLVKSSRFEDLKVVKFTVDEEGAYIKKDVVSINMVFACIKKLAK